MPSPYDEVMRDIDKAVEGVRKLTSLSEDWTSNALLIQSAESLRNEVRNYLVLIAPGFDSRKVNL